ncbi:MULTISPECIES: ArnT family glycosyltransferase [unclassified Streptomyces]|uniref:ArnT family glycosyltransferase n=1 Tax=unclassified Streptomyces TaxID=2593676 RepID=UPI003D8C49D5
MRCRRAAVWCRRHQTAAVAIVAGTAFLVTMLVRLVGMNESLDVNDDEAYYRDIGVSVGSGGFPRYQGSLFLLHPPGFFYLEAGWQRLFGFRPDLVAGIYEMRALNVLLAGGTAAVLVLLVSRVRSLPAGAAAGVLFAVEPFIVRVNSHLLLETATLFWAMTGCLLLIPLTRRRRRPPWPYARAVGAGLLLGLAILTKDEAALITVLPLLLAAVLGWGARRPLLVAAGASLLPYSAYVVVLAANHHFHEYLDVKTGGLRRFVGVQQETGFNAPGAPSLVNRLLMESPTYCVTYGLVLLGLVALVKLLRRGSPAQRLIALFQASALVTIGYTFAFGTLEEQILYLLLVPTVASVTLAASPLALRTGQPRALRQASSATVALLTLALVLSSTTYTMARTKTDDGYARLRAYMAERVPAGSRITVVGGPGVVLSDKYKVGAWLDPADRTANRVRYAVVVHQLVNQGYSNVTPAQAQALAAQGTLLFSFDGPTFGPIELYRLPLLQALPTSQAAPIHDR